MGADNGDDEDGRGDVGPEVILHTGAENHKVGARAHLEVDDVLDLGTAKVEDILEIIKKKKIQIMSTKRNIDTQAYAGNKVVRKRRASEQDTKDDRDGKELSETPLVGNRVDGGIVDRDDEGSGVVEQGNHDDEDGGERELEDRDREEKVDEEVNGRGDTVEHI